MATAWDAIVKHLPRVAAGVQAKDQQLAQLQQKLRAAGLPDEVIEQLGGPARAAQLYFVVNRATDLIRTRPSPGSIGECMDMAAEAEGVTLTVHERRTCTIWAVRTATRLDEESPS